jgi:hypothetical protein
MDEKQVLARVAERFIRTGVASDEQFTVTRLPDNKTSFVEYVAQDGRSIYLDEYTVDEKKIYAAFSSRTQTVYLSSRK